MSLCQTELPVACLREVERLLAQISDKELSTLAATHPAFGKGGFRTGKTAVIRMRLQQLLTGGAEIDDSLRAFVAKHSRSRTLIALLAPDILHECRHALATMLGFEVLVVAVLLDARPSIRQKGEEWLTQKTLFKNLTPVEARDYLRETLHDLIELVGGSDRPNSLIPTRESWREQKENLERKLREERQTVRRLKGVDDRLAATQCQVADEQKKLQATQEALNAGSQELKTLKQVHAALEITLERERKLREEQLHLALDAALAEEFHGWLGAARELEATLKNRPEVAAPTELLALADHALQKQYELDRHSGNRAQLHQRQALLRTKLTQVQECLRNAIRPAPELQEVVPLLEQELQRLTAILDPSTQTTELERRIIAQIHATKAEALPYLKDTIERTIALKLLQDSEAKQIQSEMRKRYDALQALGLPIPPQVDITQYPGTRVLAEALSGHGAALLLIDAHNVLFGTPTRYNPQRGQALSEADKRQRLIDDLKRITKHNHALRTWLVFDGPTRSDTQVARNLTVTYSGGEGEHRADRVIIEKLRFYKACETEVPLLMVSNDHDLATTAKRLGALTLPIHELTAFFIDA